MVMKKYTYEIRPRFQCWKVKASKTKVNEHNSYVLTAYNIDKAAIWGNILFNIMQPTSTILLRATFKFITSMVLNALHILRIKKKF